MKNCSYMTLIGLAGLLLTACGGSGGGGGSGSGGGGGTPAPAPAEIALDATNAAEVSGTVAETAFSADELLAGNTILGVVTEGGQANFDISRFVAEQIDRIQLLQNSAFGDGVTGVVIPAETIQCSVAGSMTVSGDIADATFSIITPGDEFNISFNGCNEGDGVTLSGGFNMVFGAIQGDLLFGGAPYSYTVMVDIGSLNVVSMGESFSADGDMTLALSSQDDITITTRISGDSLAVTQAGEVSTLTNYDITETFNDVTTAYVADTNGTFTNAGLGGTVTFSTVTSFEGVGDDWPTVGEMLIEGANGSTVNLTADGSGMVLLQVDANGDGTIDETIVSTWAEITSL